MPADTRDGLTHDRLDLGGAVLSILTIGFVCYALTSGVQFGWTSPVTLGVTAAAVASLALFIVRERRAASPMLDLTLFRSGTVRGAAIAQIGTSSPWSS